MKCSYRKLRWPFIIYILGALLLATNLLIMYKIKKKERRTYQLNISQHGKAYENRVIYVLLKDKYSKVGVQIINVLESRKMKYKREILSNSTLIIPKFPKFNLFIFESLYSYFNLQNVTREILNKYCEQYNVGIIGFINDIKTNGSTFQLFPITSFGNLSLTDYEVSTDSNIPKLIKTGEIDTSRRSIHKRVGFMPHDKIYGSIVTAKQDQTKSSFSTILHDKGLKDNVQKVIIGNDLNDWLNMLLFLDAVSYLTHGELKTNLNRYILIDIDDIFVAKTGTRMTVNDVEALLTCQRKLSQSVPGFRFNLGFSGKYFQSGTREENEADSLLIKYRNNFSWFDHTYSHKQPHLCDYTCIEKELHLNKKFALKHGIIVDSNYSVPPHHSGVYPIHSPLFKAWKNVWNVQVSSTEEYPHLRPPSKRKGFIHEGIMVLPRQTCGLYTHTIFMDKYPGGHHVLDRRIQGGTLFKTVILNPISIFMTHMTNYAKDRLSIYTFEKLVTFLKQWTNVRLLYAKPIQLGKMYFEMFPEERNSLWQNPCNDKRHLQIWIEANNCEKFPKFIIIGPQKTGTTALYDFLSLHPSLVPSIKNNQTFEEIQFFNTKNYEKGIKWYMDHFNFVKGKVLFEKTANYFDAKVVPKRIHELLPNVKVITILIHPADRAYSWYQHCRAKGEQVAIENTFYEVLTATNESASTIKELQKRCLNVGFYAKHLKLWLSYFSISSLLIVDGELLKKNPAQELDNVQKFLKLSSNMNYSNYLKYDKAKGYFCQVTSEKKMKCLGKGKGRIYPDMNDKEKEFLYDYFRKPNILLFNLLKKLSLPIPSWLKKELDNQLHQ